MESTEKASSPIPSPEACQVSLPAVTDALYVIGGKWRLPVIIALAQGHRRFNAIQRSISGISSKVLANELKELELNGFIRRTVPDESTTLAEYELTGYSDTLQDVIESLSDWGTMHREHIRKNFKSAT